MISADSISRFDELRAGRAMGDFSIEEERELDQLGGQLGIIPDATFDLLATSIEVGLLQNVLEPMPAHLATRLNDYADRLETAAANNVIRPQVAAWQQWVRSPLIGWAAAAAVVLFAFLSSQKAPTISPAQAAASLRTDAKDLIERPFGGAGSFAAASGTVIWSDDLQKGYMTLSGIPVNDAKQAQYQLWIVDPTRDEAPIDGGVFDIPASGEPVVIPIMAKLALRDPQAFVITLEKPGGVVKSKQEQVVALAKNS